MTHSMATVRIGPHPAIAVDHMGSGELVLCLHGVGGNASNWHDNLPALAAAGLTAAAWDARGYGASDDDPAPLMFNDMRDDVGRVLDHFGVERAHLIGLSMGGRIAAAFATHRPERVASVIFCDTHLGFAHMPDKDRAAFVAMRKEPLLAGKTPRDIAPTVAKTLIGDRAHTETFDRLVHSMAHVRADSYIKAVEACVAFDREEHFGNVRAPALVVVGALDRLTPPALAREIATKMPGTDVEVIDNAGHLPNIEQPDAFNRVVTDFLARVR